MSTKTAPAKKSTQKAKAGGTRRSGKTPKRVLAKAQGSQCFWVNEGPILSDLVELAEALDSMTSETYTYHVGTTRNDFADWVEYVLGDTELASLLRGSKKPRQARTIVVRRLKIYDLG